MDNSKDEAFNKFLEKIQGQNKADLALQALQVKYEREMASEDNDKREEQLDKISELLERVEKAVTGVAVKINFEPVVNALENQTQILQKSLEEQSLMRKVSEGSLEYDKESAQYRNTSGRELTSDVSGKTIKEGGYVDFETAANRLQGQGKRVRESETNQIKLKPIEMGVKTPLTGRPGDVEPREEDKEEKITGFGNLGDLGKAVGSRIKGIFDFMTNKEVQKKEEDVPNPGVQGLNPEADNVQSSQEILADSAKKDVELTKENNDILEQQLKELKKISAALEPKTPAELPEGRLKPTPASAEAEESGGGIGLGSALAGIGGLAKKTGGALLRGAKAVGTGVLTAGKGIARFAGSGAGKMLGAAAAVGMGAYTAYKGYTAAEDSKQAKMADIQSKLDAGEIDEKQAAELRKEAGNTATVEKSGAVGEGTGMAAGAIAGGAAGAKLGATIGTFVGGPVGTAVGAGIGTIAGGALGAFSGTKAGKYVGEKVGEGINAIKESETGKFVSEKVGAGVSAVKNFFGFGKDEGPGKKTEQAVKGAPTGPKVETVKSTLIANEPVVPGQPLTEKQMAVIEMSKSMGNKYSPDIEAQFAKQKGDKGVRQAAGTNQVPSAAPVTASPVPTTGPQVSQVSTENADLTREVNKPAPAAQPIVSSNVSNVNTTSYVPIKPSPRSERSGSALDRYNDRVAVY